MATKQTIQGFRKVLSPMIDRAADLMTDLMSLKEEVEQLRDELQEQYDNLSEKAQEGDAGQKKQERIDALDTAVGKVDDLLSALEECDNLNEVDSALQEAEQ